MNIQIFGKSKCFETKKAERYFKERRVKYQYIDLKMKGMSAGEYKSVKTALGGDFYKMVDTKCKLYEETYFEHLAYDEDKEQKLLDYPLLLASPIVRNGRQATVGFCPDVWQKWIDAEK